MGSSQPPSRPPLSTLLPKIIIGGGVYNTQMNSSPSTLPVRSLLHRAFSLGINAIDTSPYYGPSEILLGDALSHPEISREYPRESYILMTKVGRVGLEKFDYSPGWIRTSVGRSLQRLNTSYLDVVFCHDVEFVSEDEVLGAIEMLWKLVEEGMVRYVGISGYPHRLLAGLAVRIRHRCNGRPLDVVQNYSHFNLQNTTLEQSLDKIRTEGGVDCVLNASPLSMKLLTGVFPGGFHPAPRELLEVCAAAARWCKSQGESLPEVAMRFAFAKWGMLRERNGGGFTISGVSYVEELESNVRVFREVMKAPSAENGQGEEALSRLMEVDLEALKRYEAIFEGVKKILGNWVDYSWGSPPQGWLHIQARRSSSNL